MRQLGAFLTAVSSKPALVMLFLILAAPPIFEMSRLTPPGQAPDEPAHLVRAEGLLHGAILAVRKYGFDSDSPVPVAVAGVKVNPGIARIVFNRPASAGGLFQIPLTDKPELMRLTYHQPRLFITIDNTAQYFPAAYLPATAGLAIGLALHQPPLRCFHFARYGMMLAYLLLGAAAIFCAPGGESILLAILFLPIPLFLAGTVSEDGVLIAAACLSAALFARDPREHKFSRLAALFILTIILGAKAPYIPLAALALIPLAKAHFRTRLFQMFCVITPVLIWSGIIAAFVAVPFLRPPYHPGPLYTGDHNILLNSTSVAKNLKILLAQPSRFVTMPAHLIALAALQWSREIIGILGTLQLQFPDPFYDKWWLALGIAALGAAFPARTRAIAARVTPATSLFIIAVIALTIWLIMIAMYLSWTDIGKAVIDGIQGRYFVLLLPFLALAIPRFSLRVPAIIPSLPALAMAAFDVYYLPERVWENFAMMH
jgi:uncharacterized membrane protein